MASVFPYRSSIDHTPRESAVVVDGSDSSDVLGALTSETAQAILEALRSDPGTVSDIANAVDTSLQNAHYHISRLCEVGLVESIDTWYSAKGKEMTVYALTTEQLVVQFDAQSTSP